MGLFKRMPYGISNFKQVRREGLYFVDKSEYIQKLEYTDHFFLMPDQMRYPMIEHSYILELKYLKTDATEAEARRQWDEAVAQIRQYGQGPKVQLMKQQTTLHLIVVQIRGYELQKMEEV